MLCDVYHFEFIVVCLCWIISCKHRNPPQVKKPMPTLLNLPLQGSILIPLFFYYVALSFMHKQICEIRSDDNILWYICTNTSLAFVANFVLINYQWMNCSEFHLQPTSFGFNVLEFSRVFPRPGFPRSKLSQASQPGPPPTVDKKGGVGATT